MAINRVIKTLNNLSKAFSDIDDDFFREGTKEYGKEIQGRLLDGISGATLSVQSISANSWKVTQKLKTYLKLK